MAYREHITTTQWEKNPITKTPLEPNVENYVFESESLQRPQELWPRPPKPEEDLSVILKKVTKIKSEQDGNRNDAVTESDGVAIQNEKNIYNPLHQYGWKGNVMITSDKTTEITIPTQSRDEKGKWDEAWNENEDFSGEEGEEEVVPTDPPYIRALKDRRKEEEMVFGKEDDNDTVLMYPRTYTHYKLDTSYFNKLKFNKKFTNFKLLNWYTYKPNEYSTFVRNLPHINLQSSGKHRTDFFTFGYLLTLLLYAAIPVGVVALTLFLSIVSLQYLSNKPLRLGTRPFLRILPIFIFAVFPIIWTLHEWESIYSALYEVHNKSLAVYKVRVPKYIEYLEKEQMENMGIADYYTRELTHWYYDYAWLHFETHYRDWRKCADSCESSHHYWWDWYDELSKDRWYHDSCMSFIGKDAKACPGNRIGPDLNVSALVTETNRTYEHYNRYYTQSCRRWCAKEAFTKCEKAECKEWTERYDECRPIMFRLGNATKGYEDYYQMQFRSHFYPALITDFKNDLESIRNAFSEIIVVMQLVHVLFWIIWSLHFIFPILFLILKLKGQPVGGSVQALSIVFLGSTLLLSIKAMLLMIFAGDFCQDPLRNYFTYMRSDRFKLTKRSEDMWYIANCFPKGVRTDLKVVNKKIESIIIEHVYWMDKIFDAFREYEQLPPYYSHYYSYWSWNAWADVLYMREAQKRAEVWIRELVSCNASYDFVMAFTPLFGEFCDKSINHIVAYAMATIVAVCGFGMVVVAIHAMNMDHYLDQ